MAMAMTGESCLGSAAPAGLYPWLVVRYEDDQKHALFSPSEPYKNYHLTDIPFLGDKVVWASSHEWLLLSYEPEDDEDEGDVINFLIWNPNTDDSIQLPVLTPKPNRNFSEVVLSWPTNEGSIMALLFDELRQSIMVCSLEKKEWIELSCAEECKRMTAGDEDFYMNPAICNGKVYARLSTAFCRFVEINLVLPDSVELRPLDCGLPRLISDSSRLDRYLVESCGELFYFEIAYGGVDFERALEIGCFRLNLDSSKLEWKEVGSESRDRAFFLSESNSFSCINFEQQFKGGHVYCVSEDPKTLYSFDMEHGSLTMSLPCKDLPEPWFSSFWTLSTLRPRNTMSGQILGTQRRSNDVEENELNEKGAPNSYTPPHVGVSLSDLPDAIVWLIANNLTLIDYINFRATCKTCHLLAPPIKWGETSPDKLETHSLCPWLMFSRKNSATYCFIDPKLGGEYLINMHEPLLGAKIRCSNDGWVLMSKVAENSLFFYNPFTKATVTLPQARERYSGCFGFCFTGAPTSPDCIVVGVNPLGLEVIKMTDEEWQEIWVEEFISEHFCVNHNTPVLHNEAFYCLGEKGNLAVLRLEELGSSFTILDNPSKPCSDFHESFLLEWKGKRASVFFGKAGIWVRAFTLNDVKMVWEEVKDLGNYSWFVSRSSCFSAVAKVSWMENKIYLPRISGQNNLLYYCLKTGNFGCTGMDKTSTNYDNTIEYPSSCWIEPNWL